MRPTNQHPQIDLLNLLNLFLKPATRESGNFYTCCYEFWSLAKIARCTHCLPAILPAILITLMSD